METRHRDDDYHGFRLHARSEAIDPRKETMNRSSDHGMDIHPGAPLSRRAALAGAGAIGAGVLGASLVRPPEASAASGAPFIVVDAAGGGDYTDFEQAVAAAPAGSHIYVKEGLYLIKNGDVQPADGVRIEGAGFGAHIKAKDGLNANLIVIRNDSVVIEKLRIDGNAANQTANSNCVWYTGTNGVVRDCFVHDANGYNIVGFPGATQWIVAGNHSYSTSSSKSYPHIGIELQGATYCTVVENYVFGVRDNGIYLWNSSGDNHHNAVVGNVVRDCGVTGIELEDGAHDNSVVGNVVNNCRWGIWLNDNGGTGAPKYNTVSGNAVTGSQMYGIQLNGVSASTISNNSVRGGVAHGINAINVRACAFVANSVTENRRVGIMLQDSSDCVVDGNVAVNNGQDPYSGTQKAGVFLSHTSGTCTDNVVTNNRCVDTQSSRTQSYGIVVSDGANGNFVAHNVLDGNGVSGLLLQGSAASSTDAAPYHRLSATVGSGQTAIPHGLSYTPTVVVITPRSQGTIWESASPDSTKIYLRADANGRTADILVG
jgi:parallel beta-helix repeat protein